MTELEAIQAIADNLRETLVNITACKSSYWYLASVPFPYMSFQFLDTYEPFKSKYEQLRHGMGIAIN